MTFLAFVFGVLVGLFFSTLKFLVDRQVENIEQADPPIGKTQFIEPVSPRETIDKIFKNE